MTVEVRALGGFEVVVDGNVSRDIENRPVCSALLLYLAVEGRATRESVLTVLWPDRSESRARHSLSQSLYQLRRLLGRRRVPGRSRELRLADDVRVDAVEFARGVDAGRNLDAVELYRGAFLAGWQFRGLPEFERWVDDRAERFRRLHRMACRRAVRSLVDGGDRRSARQITNRWVELDPLGADAHRERIRLLAEEGADGEALACFAKYEKRLADHDLVPGADIRAAIEPVLLRQRSSSSVGRSQLASRQPRIVVLPFAHTGQPELAHFTYGLGDETARRLSMHEGLAVIARSSTFPFVGGARSLTEIGSELRVDYVLEAAVHWLPADRGASAIISPQLVRVADGRQLWAAQLDTDVEGIGGLHVRLADRTLSALDLTPLADGATGERERALHPQAWELYVRGVQHWHQRGSADLDEAADLFIRAIELQPDFAQAYAGLALTYAMMPSFVGATPGVWMPRARRAAERALELDPDSPEGHLAAGIIAWTYDLDPAAAGRHWQLTQDRLPSNAQVRTWRAYRLAAVRRPDEAREQLATALALDPLSVSTNFDAGMVHWQLRDEAQARVQLRRVLQLDPEFVPAAFILGTHHFRRGEIDDARREWSRINSLGPSWNTMLEKLDDPPRAAAAVDRIVELSPQPVHWYAMAVLYSLFGVPAKAMFWIDAHLRSLKGEAAPYPTGGPSLFHAATDPGLDGVRSMPGFQRILQALRLDVDSD